MDVEGPLPLGGTGGMVETIVASVGMPLMGGMPIAVCVVIMGPLEGIPMMIGDKHVGHFQLPLHRRDLDVCHPWG